MMPLPIINVLLILTIANCVVIVANLLIFNMMLTLYFRGKHGGS